MKKMCFLFLIITLYLQTNGQQIRTELQGKVNSAGVPVAGATVQSRANKRIALADGNGFFVIRISAGADTLDVSGSGYQKVAVPVNSSMTGLIEIELPVMSKELEQAVINTGYQKIPKERSTGSFTQISKKLFNQQTGTNVIDRLESISNGLYFDRQTGTSGTRIIIRGLSTIQGPSSPLIILDNFPYEGDLNNINPNDVESITILKDAAAASIWGTRAGNGVIVITTKKGRFNQRTRIEFGSSVLITQQPKLSYIKEISPGDLINAERFLYNKGFYTSQISTQPYLYVTPAVETLIQRDLGNINSDQANAKLAELSGHRLLDDLDKYVYKTGVNYQHFVSANGGSQNMSWNMSAGYDHNDDILHAKYDRYKFRDGHVFRVNKSLDVSVGLDYTQSITTAGRQGYNALRPGQGVLPVYTQLADANGNALAVPYRYRSAYTDTVGKGKLLDWKWYPLIDNESVENKKNMQAILGDIGIQYRPVKNVSLNMQYQHGIQNADGKILYGTGSYFTREMINQYSTVNYTTGKVTYNVPTGEILDREKSLLVTNNVRGQINYNKANKLHRIDAIIGGEYRSIESDYSTDRTYGYNRDNLRFSDVDYVTMFPDIITGSTNNISSGRNFSGTATRNISVYSNAAYTYQTKYTVSGSIRRDASNLFGASSNNKWTPLWSAGAAWDISKEKFYRTALVPALKIRMSYGVSGNADPLRSAVTVIQYNGTSASTQLPIAIISQFGNDQLRWEKIRMANFGVDFTGKNSRLSGSIEYYHKKGIDLFGTSPVDFTGLAFNYVTKNVAKISGHGWDLNLNSRNLVGKVSWSSQLNLNTNRDKVLQYYLVNKQGSNFVSGTNVSAIEGKPVYALYDYVWAGLDPTNGDPLGTINGAVSKDYKGITGSGTQIENLRYVGPTLPRVVASLGNTVTWKNFSFTFRVTGKFGHYFQRSSIDYTMLFGFRNGHSDYGLRWQNPGDELHTNVPSMVYPNNTSRNTFYNNSEVLATKADFIRLQYMSLSYEFVKPAIQVYMNANNLGLLWKANHYGIDPEYQNNLPASANIAFGFRATF